jgi:hypothetical protein
MPAVLRHFCWLAVLSFAVSATGFAGTLRLSAFCVNDPGSSLSEALFVTPPFGESVGCTDNSFASAFGNRADLVSVTANRNASAFYESLVQVTFNGGSGEAFYVPCLRLNYAASGGSGAAFGPVDLGSKFPFGGTCFSSLLPSSRILFTFGIPQVQTLSLGAESVGPLGSGDASIQGFIVLDADGNRIPTATWTAVEYPVPEPGLFVPASIALALAAVLSRRVRRAQDVRGSEAAINSSLGSFTGSGGGGG